MRSEGGKKVSVVLFFFIAHIIAWEPQEINNDFTAMPAMAHVIKS